VRDEHGGEGERPHQNAIPHITRGAVLT